MPNLDHLRWHLALALGGALFIELFHGPLLAGLLALIVLDRVAMTAWRLVVRRRGAQAGPMTVAEGRDGDRPRPPSPPARRTPRLPRSLTRALDADCPTCRGFGCRACAYTGLG